MPADRAQDVAQHHGRQGDEPASHVLRVAFHALHAAFVPAVNHLLEAASAANAAKCRSQGEAKNQIRDRDRPPSHRLILSDALTLIDMRWRVTRRHASSRRD